MWPLNADGAAPSLDKLDVGSMTRRGLNAFNGFAGLGTPTTEGLNGIASCREGLVIVTRVPAAPTTGGGEQMNVTDPESGFTFALRSTSSSTGRSSPCSTSPCAGCLTRLSRP